MKPPRTNHPRRARITSSLPGPLRHRLSEHSAAKGIYECEALRSAVEQYLDGTSDMTLLYRSIASNNRKIDRLQRMLELNGEMLNACLHLYLEAASPATEAANPARRRKARLLYQAIVDRVTETLSSGKTWVDDLPKELLSPTAAEPTEPGSAVESTKAKQ
jgi:hypothetical protein